MKLRGRERKSIHTQPCKNPTKSYGNLAACPAYDSWANQGLLRRPPGIHPLLLEAKNQKVGEKWAHHLEFIF